MLAFVCEGAVLAVLVVAAASTSGLTTTRFRVSSQPHHNGEALGKPLQTLSVIDCVRVCNHGYTGCFSVTYNTKTGVCIPRSKITFALSNVPRLPEELFFYTNPCNIEAGFYLHVLNTEVKCVYVSHITHTYTDARKICKEYGAGLILVKTEDKLELLRSIVNSTTRDKTWVGLTDIVKEGVYVWEDGKHATQIPWQPGQPDNSHDREDCVEMGSSNDFLHFNDYICSEKAQFICEMD